MLAVMTDSQKGCLMVAVMAETRVGTKVTKTVAMMADQLEHMTAAEKV